VSVGATEMEILDLEYEGKVIFKNENSELSPPFTFTICCW